MLIVDGSVATAVQFIIQLNKIQYLQVNMQLDL